MKVYNDVEWGVSYNIVENNKDLFLVYKLLKDEGLKRLVIDVETEKGDGEEEEGVGMDLIGLGLGWSKERIYYLPWRVWKDDVDLILRGIIELVLSKDILVGHNLKFDIKVLIGELKKRGRFKDYDFLGKNKKVVDSMVMSYLLDERRGVHSLKFVASHYLNLDGYKYLREIGDIEDLGKEDLYKVGVYCCSDVYMTYCLADLLMERIYEEGLEEVLKLCSELEKVLIVMECEGICVDVEYLGKVREKVDNLLLRLVDEMKSEVKESDINFSSPKQLRELLFGKLGLKPLGLTKGGEYSTSEEVLEKLAEESSFVRKLLEYRKWMKIKTTYVEGMLERVVDVEGEKRIKCVYLIHGTETGRLSSRNPNLQNLPVGGLIRCAFVGRKGYKLVDVDYNQIELRVCAVDSGDEEMIKVFKDGKDLHSEVAKECYNLDCEVEEVKEKYPEFRKRAKGVNFGIIYGRGAKSLAEELKISFEEAEMLLERYFNRFSGVKRRIEEVKRFVVENEYVENMFGRRRRFKGVKRLYQRVVGGDKNALYELEEVYRKAYNAIIQSSASDITNLALVKVWRDVFRCKTEIGYPVLQVHDEIVFCVREEVVEDFVKEVKYICENVVDFEVPLVVDIEVLDRWGRKDIEKDEMMKILGLEV